MRFPKIDSDDALLFGGLGLAALGVALVTLVTTGEPWLALGLPLLFFGILAALIAFMAAAEPTK